MWRSHKSYNILNSPNVNMPMPVPYFFLCHAQVPAYLTPAAMHTRDYLRGNKGDSNESIINSDDSQYSSGNKGKTKWVEAGEKEGKVKKKDRNQPDEHLTRAEQAKRHQPTPGQQCFPFQSPSLALSLPLRLR